MDSPVNLSPSSPALQTGIAGFLPFSPTPSQLETTHSLLRGRTRLVHHLRRIHSVCRNVRAPAEAAEYPGFRLQPWTVRTDRSQAPCRALQRQARPQRTKRERASAPERKRRRKASSGSAPRRRPLPSRVLAMRTPTSTSLVRSYRQDSRTGKCC